MLPGTKRTRSSQDEDGSPADSQRGGDDLSEGSEGKHDSSKSGRSPGDIEESDSSDPETIGNGKYLVGVT